MKSIVSLAFAGLLGLSGSAFATLLHYSISGFGSGSLNSVLFSETAFSIDMIGDTAKISIDPLIGLDPLQSATVTITGFNPAILNIATRLGLSGTVVFFSRGNKGADLFDFTLAVPVNLAAPFGPVTSTGITVPPEFQNVSSTAGPLSFTSSSNVAFAATGPTAVPEPQTYALLLAGLGVMLVGFARRKVI